ncbi:hypothetical protein METBIDRAFT_68511 [Metschnikowia bicuspidata var. bicuspidata NRRL YB-4993]|uniref:RRM domain-containing protein n=1 Tax=Metschnikowia bicuspidata var. bicuspidata NRRL YB-4993 TaxID=869754 RepID=A0A1A0HEL7_9ASCO|nr:hypothetical protein METBIDRAFT_68511 [Metschnikowia bicuspidata var. bicuspidata NRRL YB-4993]OBA22564.1 hypothetical protein METBIDRAFT_68511 [Metschnikowia bicuspidata var. bicuspidata NRRL YB-4993]
MAEEKLSKKQQKALSFRKSKEERTQEKIEKKTKKELDSSLKRKLDEETQPESSEEKKAANGEADKTDGEPEKKKRKTRRGKKGKGVNGGKGPRFILFVGNLPYDTQQAELDTHFKNAKPDRIRIRREKGIAFLEFDNDNQAIQSKMDHALGMHHLVFRDRKINVELTVGGGGNSEVRTQKLKEKNDKLMDERKEKVKKELAKRTLKTDQDLAAAGGMHPARAALLKQ